MIDSVLFPEHKYAHRPPATLEGFYTHELVCEMEKLAIRSKELNS